MFTGIVRQVGEVISCERRGGLLRLCVDVGELASDVTTGDSVNISGVCLTATGVDGDCVSFDVVGETLSRSTLGELKPGDRVNVELPVSAGGRFGGHFVLGHVDCAGKVKRVGRRGQSVEVEVVIPEEHLAFVVEKGSVALDGVSLTVASLASDGFSVALVPHTLAATTLSEPKPGDLVNVETDIIGKYVARLLQSGEKPQSGITKAFLEEHGFA